MLDEDPERPSPVADVVLAHHLVSEERQHAHQRVTDDRAAHVADVQLLGGVRRRVVDKVAPSRLGGDTQSGIPGDSRQHRGEQGVLDRQVDEAGTGDLGDGDTGEIGRGDDVTGDVTR